MWIAKLKIIDTIKNTENSVDYKFSRIIKYIDLYRDLPIILRFIGYEDCRFRTTQITFTFKYLEKNIIVDNWYNKYILNRDEIEIKISYAPPIYSLIDSLTGNILVTSKNINKMYLYYHQILKPKVKSAVLLKSDNSLLDVLDEPSHYLNDCINTLIHRFNF